MWWGWWRRIPGDMVNQHHHHWFTPPQAPTQKDQAYTIIQKWMHKSDGMMKKESRRYGYPTPSPLNHPTYDSLHYQNNKPQHKVMRWWRRRRGDMVKRKHHHHWWKVLRYNHKQYSELERTPIWWSMERKSGKQQWTHSHTNKETSNAKKNKQIHQQAQHEDIRRRDSDGKNAVLPTSNGQYLEW